MQHLKYQCPKCQNRSFKTGEVRATGGVWSKIFDVQNQKFTTVICERCTYTEFYKTKTSAISNIFDLFTN